ncbi:MAG: aldehyde dehydrogenase family protein [Blastomonas sp.]|uniref:aldehyde dehydrogenase family protein n=1 Tax=Blastomonas sp. TaxID=1909299 RepID=UPI0025828141|nr:aldehyde dehydrogenase family protein [Blastomonas sp.]MCO5791532.1 aldehyde dehydrogenase family protein [Blastomonas sp.]
MKVINPRTGEADYEIAPLDAAAVQAEAKRLRAAQPAWAALDPQARADILRRWADAVVAHREPLLEALTLDTGRRRISEIEVDGLPGTIRRWADLAPRLIAEHSRDNQPSAHPTVRNSTRLVPYPLFGAIAPWNFPIVLSTIDAIPALAAGCAALVKPSEVTPRFIAPLMETVAKVPELAAVLTFIEGDAATGQALVDAVDYVCFTGSVATGRKVAEAAARTFIPANLELGGKDPMIVLASADPVQAANLALRASIVATGQACQSIERIYVARTIYQPFLDALVEAAQKVRLNYPDIAMGDIGPFIFGPQGAKVQAQIDEAVAMGAKVLTGGSVETLGGGQYLRPTVIADAAADMGVVRDETFGPVLPVISFDDVEDAIQQANDSVYGLSAAVVAATAEEAESIAVRLQAGAVSINDGSMTSMVWDAENSSFKLSGMGPSRMGESGLLRFFRLQALIRQTGAPLPLAAYAEDAPR